MLSRFSIPILNKLSRNQLVIAGVIGLGILIPLFLLIISLLINNNPSDTNNQSLNAELVGQERNGNTANDISSATLVYGAWEGEQSLIKAVDLVTNRITLLAQLPQNIKKVSIISPSQLLYINQTDTKDHGQEIVLFNMKDKQVKTVLKTDEEFGIDDYVLSPNKRYLAIWEVSFKEGSKIFQGGRSRVYAIDLSRPQTKHLLYDETATAPVHYPQAVTNSGVVFADKFMPNDPNGGAGWAYGMSVVRFDGTQKQDLTNMQEGTYGTQPFPSEDGKFLIFAGYDGSKGDGKAIINGFRRALLSPNTVEVLDTSNLRRQKLPNLPNGNIYSGVDWGATSNDIIVTSLSKNKSQSGLFSYSLTDKSLRKVNLPKEGKKSFSYVAQTASSGLLIGTVDDTLSGVGNLGDSYIPSLTRLYFQPKGSAAAKLIGLDNVLVQYVSLLPANYFEGVLGTHTSNDNSFNSLPTLINTLSDNYTDSRNMLQLRTFLLPSKDLTETRQDQQTKPVKPSPTPTPTPTSTPTPTPTQRPTNTPTPRPLATQAAIPTSTPTPTAIVIPTRLPTRTPAPTRNISRRPTPTPTPRFVEDCTELAEIQCAEVGLSADSEEFDECVDTNKEKNRATRGTANAVCSRSPLYLYGREGLNVNVVVQTNVYNSTPLYNNGYIIKLLSGGLMAIQNELYQSIKYDYKPNLRVLRPPSRGKIVASSEIKKVLTEYGQKLGLNKKEIADLVSSGKENVKSSYVFISFFDQATSEQILPLSLTPKPDNYLNVVFYFKQLNKAPDYTPGQPIFPKPLKRTGFTAVEVSEIIE